MLVILLAGGLWVGGRTLTAREQLTGAAVLLRTMRQQMQARDIGSARTTLVALQEKTGAARSATRGLDWRLGGRLPALGEDVDAVRTASVVLDDLARQVLPDLVDLAGTVDLGSLVPRGGRFALGPLREAQPRLSAIDSEARAARAVITAIPARDLLPQLRSAIAQFVAGLDQLLGITGTAARAAVLLPAMLGLDGPRTYLVIFQNPAEIRATGGMPGAFLTMRANGGRVRLLDQGSASGDLQVFDRPVLPLEPAMRALYTDRLGTFPADVNLTPHFPTTALLVREMYRRRTGISVDGVLSVDPVALSYLLRATGPVTMPIGPTLTADTAVRILLADSYRMLTASGLAGLKDKERYFSTAARRVFDRLAVGTVNPELALAALGRAAGERRLLLWSAHAPEQKAIEGTTLEGALPSQDGARPTVGVFLNDGSGAKLSYYLTGAAHVAAGACRRDGRRELALRVTLGSKAPARGLPEYVLGMGLAGDPYTVRTQVLIFSPAGGAVETLRLDGASTRFGAGTERRRAVSVLMVDLKPGQRRIIEADLLTGTLPSAAEAGSPAEVKPQVWTTPGVNPWSVSTDSAPACDASG